MKVLVTGAKGFVGKNLCAQLNNIKDGKARHYGDLTIEAVYEYDIDSQPEELEAYCQKADFVFNLAGVNRPKEQAEFMEGNFGFASTLLNTLKKYGNTCPCSPLPFRRPCKVGLGTVNMAGARKRARNYFLHMARRLEPRCWSIASRICTGNGADLIITRR